jgi:dimeric dUTPase (all-alpha-NTP-PPase superfamily)
MNFDSLYDTQLMLDQRIQVEHGLSVEEIYPKKLLALQVELCELANETRCFKYWSKKGSAPKTQVLEEFVDALHFVLGLGLDLGYRDVPIPASVSSVSEPVSERELTMQFQTLLTHCVALCAPSRGAYATLFSELLALGRMLGFSEREIQDAYLEKNKINHLRQNEGY